MKQFKVVLVVHNVRSALNVGSLLRTADGLAVNHVYLTGYTPYPEMTGDSRLPHVRLRATKQIHKTALGAEDSIKWTHQPDIDDLITRLRKNGFSIAALEQTANSIKLNEFSPKADIALLLGSEVEGIDKRTLGLVDFALEIPMFGDKESFNVAVAGAIALYQLRLGS